jgi:SAM-dependent methyltransferase
MLDVLAGLPAGARVLDLGAGSGSFAADSTHVALVRLDLHVPAARKSGAYVAADAARMPFASGSFDAIISNHSLEHFERLDETLAEVGRVIKPEGVLYVAVPDAATLTDRIYRWLGRGGGHVNAFRRPEDVVAPVERLTGLRRRSARDLYSSLSFLNRHNFVAPPPRRIALFAFGSERFLALLLWLLRAIDRRRGSGLSRYGWSFWFGNAEVPESPAPWINVCVRCGAGHSVAFLRKRQALEPWIGRLDQYSCPECGGWNLLSPEAGSPAT